MSNKKASSKNLVKETSKSEKLKTNSFKFEGLFKWITVIISTLTITALFDVGKFR